MRVLPLLIAILPGTTVGKAPAPLAEVRVREPGTDFISVLAEA